MEISINEHLQKTALFERFKEQLYKDFELTGFSDVSPKITSNQLSHIYQEVLNAILTIERKDVSGLKNLLYRIDVTENQIKKEMALNSNKTFQQIISELIIKRVLQKVILKQTYS